MERKVIKGITIDSESTRDIDDALWIEFQDDGFWHIFVSIADVAETVSPGDTFDVRAREMVTTKYFGTGNSPMLPRRLAEDELSLWPHKERKTVTVEITMRWPETWAEVARDRARLLQTQLARVEAGAIEQAVPDALRERMLEPLRKELEATRTDLELAKSIDTTQAEIVKTEIYPSTLTSQGRITYDKIPTLLQEKPQTAEYDVISIGCKMAMQLLDRRRKAGAFVLYDLNNGWVTTEEGFLRKLEKKEETIGHVLIQEMMVLANAQVAEFAVKNDIPVLFRNHMAMSAMPDRQILMGQIEDALTTPLADLDTVRQRTHMLLGKASYSDSLLGHYGLNLPAYLHFTSPIRRYADLITQRQIKAYLDGTPLPYAKADVEQIAHHINDTLELERERTSQHFKTLDEQKAHRAIDARRLDGLDATHFERVTKVEARSGNDPSDGFEEAFLRRLKESLP